MRSVIVVLLALLTVGCSGSRPLFDGTGLSGWESDGGVEWSVGEGEIAATGSGDGYLYSREQFGDFELRAEFWVDATTNSGIFIRCQDEANIHPDTCFELNIWDLHPQQQARTGAIVFKVMPPLARVDTVGRWNTYFVRADGRSLTVKVNDVLTATMDNADPRPGFIALQHFAAGTVRFRNITVRAL